MRDGGTDCGTTIESGEEDGDGRGGGEDVADQTMLESKPASGVLTKNAQFR